MRKLWITYFLGEFRAYDWRDAVKNLEAYDQPIPPLYNLKNVIVPAAIFYGNGDTISGAEVRHNFDKLFFNTIWGTKI